MSKPLDGKVALVTGAGNGIGAAIAMALAQQGAKVTVSDLNIDQATKTKETIEAAGGTALSIAADVANKFQCVHLIETSRETWGQLDILVNANSIAPKIPIYRLDEWDFVRVMDVMLKGTFFMSQLCGRVMMDENGERGGAILNIGARSGLVEPSTTSPAYGTAIAAIAGFTRECAAEFAPSKINVSMVIPNFAEQAFNTVTDQALIDQFVRFALPHCVPTVNEIDYSEPIYFQ